MLVSGSWVRRVGRSGADAEDQRPGLGDAGDRQGDADEVGVAGGAAADAQQRLAAPGALVQGRLRRHHHTLRQVVLAQVGGHGGRHLGRPGDVADLRHDGLRHLGEQGDAAVQVALAALGDQVRLGAGEAAARLGHGGVLGLGVAGVGLAEAAEDGLAGGAQAALPRRCRRPCSAFQRVMKVSPWGAGMSRVAVQPPASGSALKRPLALPIRPRPAHREAGGEAVERRALGEEAPRGQPVAGGGRGEAAAELLLAPVAHQLGQRDADRADLLAAAAEGGGVGQRPALLDADELRA
jgi:hypothetical protein